MPDHKLTDIEGFSQDLARKLVDNFSINSAEGFLAMDAVIDREWFCNQLIMANDDIDKAIDLAKSVLTEEEIKLYSQASDVGCWKSGFDMLEEEEGEYNAED